MDIFAARLRAARELRGLNQRELGARVGIAATSIAHFEAGRRRPSMDNLRRLANALEVTADFLLGSAEQPAPTEQTDPLLLDIARLDGDDRVLARDILHLLASRRTATPRG